MYRTDRTGVSGQVNPKLFKKKGCNSACGDASNGFSSGCPTAAPVIAKAIFGVKGVVCVSRTIAVLDTAVIMGTLIGIGNQKGQRGSGCFPVENAGEDTVPDPLPF